MMLFYRFNILNDIHKLRMVVVLVLRNWRIIDRLRWTIGTKLSFIYAAYVIHIVHIIVVITIHNNYPFLFWNTPYCIRRETILPVRLTWKAMASRFGAVCRARDLTCMSCNLIRLLFYFGRLDQIPYR